MKFEISKSLFEPRSLNGLAPAQLGLTYAALLVWTIIVVFPIYWVAITSIKIPLHVNDGPVFLPFADFQPSLHAWKYIFLELGRDTLRPYLNSIIIALFSTTLATVIGSMAAYALVRIQYRVKIASVLAFLVLLALTVLSVVQVGLPWPLAAGVAIALLLFFVRSFSQKFSLALGNNDIMFWIISNRILPPVVAVLPIYLMFQQVGILDTHLAMIITYTAVNLPIVVWLMRDFFSGVPKDLEENAEIDGASRFRIFATINLPLVKPGLVATFLLVLILAWNEYLLALFISTVDAQTMPLLVAAQNATRGPQWWYMSVLIVIMIAPIIAVSILLQKHIARGLLVGAVKG